MHPGLQRQGRLDFVPRLEEVFLRGALQVRRSAAGCPVVRRLRGGSPWVWLLSRVEFHRWWVGNGSGVTARWWMVREDFGAKVSPNLNKRSNMDSFVEFWGVKQQLYYYLLLRYICIHAHMILHYFTHRYDLFETIQLYSLLCCFIVNDINHDSQSSLAENLHWPESIWWLSILMIRLRVITNRPAHG